MDGRRVPGERALDQRPAVLWPDALSPGRAAGLAGAIVPVSVMGGSMACADELPDGLVIADHAGRVLVFNRAASRLTGIPARAAHGADIRQILPLRDTDGRCWWASAKPYHGLSIRSRHPEMSLYLGDGTELLVTVSYVRGPRASALDPALPGDPVSTRGGQVRRLVIMLRYYLDLPFDEVAAIASISVVAARARASRAVRGLERQLGMSEQSA